MCTNEKNTGRSLWSGALLLIVLAAGCSSNKTSENSNGAIPTVNATSPKDGSVPVALNNKVVATFSEAMDVTTIDSISFTVKGSGMAEKKDSSESFFSILNTVAQISIIYHASNDSN